MSPLAGQAAGRNAPASEKSAALRLCRDGRSTEVGAAFRKLLRIVAEERLQGLVAAEGRQAARLQGAVCVLREILRDVENEPTAQGRPDGAYA